MSETNQYKIENFLSFFIFSKKKCANKRKATDLVVGTWIKMYISIKSTYTNKCKSHRI